MEPSADPFVFILAAGLVGFLAGAALIFMTPKHQPALRYMVVGIAVLIMVADAMGYKLISFGSAIDPSDPSRVIPLTELLAPRIAFLGFMGGIISFGIDQRIQNAFGILVGIGVLMNVSGGFAPL